jgi:hypothetical protein
MVLFFKKIIFQEEVSYTAKNNIFDNIPILLVEESCESIRSWSLCRANARESIENFLLRWYGTKINITSEEMEFLKRERSSSGQDGFEVEKSEVKCEEKQFPMSLRSVIHAPEGSLRKSTEALLLLMRVET